MTDRLSDLLISSAIDASGNTLSGAQLFFYRVGTSTKKDTYSDSDKTIANANPLVLDSAGRLPSDVFMLTDEQYKIVLAPSTDTDPPTSPIFTRDNVSPVRSNPVADINTLAKGPGNYTVLIGDKGKWINVDASSGAVTITLPAVATATNGFFVYVKKVDSSVNAVTVDAVTSDVVTSDVVTSDAVTSDAVTVDAATVDESPAVDTSQAILAFEQLTLKLDGFVLDARALVNSRILPYVRMVASVLERRTIRREELIASLLRSLRQRSIARVPRRQYVLRYLNQHPP